jgi:hypothetical protein
MTSSVVTAARIWLTGDYNQAESRVVAWRGPVPKLKQWYKEGQDVHLNTTKLIARVIQQSGIKMPERNGVKLFTRFAWDAPCISPDHVGCLHYKKGDEEREQTKRIIHGGNYDVGIKKTALILGCSEEIAAMLLKIYFAINPEIKGNYHVWIQNEVKRTRTLRTPPPVEFPAVIWDILNNDTYRACYARYPQSTVGALTVRNIRLCSRIFLEDDSEEFRDQWCTWYGMENWNKWRILRVRNIRTPEFIRWSGFDIRLNGHDSASISIPNDPDLLSWAARYYRKIGEVPIEITKEDPLIIPIDFKVGSTLAGADMKDFKLKEAA